MHADEDVQLTPFSTASVFPGGLCVYWVVHAEPFQLSASGKVPVGVVNEPTASQAEGVQDTPSSWLEIAVRGIWGYCAVQPVPFQ